MPAIYDYSVPFTLSSPQGTLALNASVALGGGLTGYFMLVNKDCDSGVDLRITRDDIPQLSGEIGHLHFKAGYEVRLKMQLWGAIGAEARPACAETLVRMADLLQLKLNSLVDDDPVRPLSIVADPLGLAQLHWTPAGYPDRMLNDIRLIERPILVPSSDDEALMEASFAFMSDRPYAMDGVQTRTILGGPIPAICPAAPGGVCPDAGLSGTNPSTIVNGGTSDYYPVTRVYGPFDRFTLVNASLLDINGLPLQIVYDKDNPGAHSVGAGHYIEIDHWANTVYRDSNVANYFAGITVPSSDFWQLKPGNNVVGIGGGYTGAGVAVLWQNAWA